MSNSKSREVDELDDSVVAGLLAQDAANYALRYSAHGLDALKPQKSFASQPKPNTRFLRQIIKSTDSHNAALLAKEAAESKAQLERLETPESQRQRRLNSGPRDISKRQFGEINAILSGRKPTYTDHSPKSEEKPTKKLESSCSSKRRYDDSTSSDRRSRHHHHRESDDDRAYKRRRSTSRDCSWERNHRHSRSSSRLPSRSRSRSRERHDKTTKSSRSSHSHCRRDRSRDHSVRQRSYSPHMSRRKYRKRREERQKEDWREKERKECRERSSKRKREKETVRFQEDNSSKDDEYGPISAGGRKEKKKEAAGGCSQVKLRGRGAVSEVSGIDRRFDADYDPRADTSGTSKKALRKTLAIDDDVKRDARESGWDSAVDAYRLQQKTKVGLTREEVRAEQEQLLATVQWKKKGEERDWDLGKEPPNE